MVLAHGGIIGPIKSGDQSRTSEPRAAASDCGMIVRKNLDRLSGAPAFRGGYNMAVDQVVQKVQDALKLSKLRSKLPRNLKVVDIQVEDYVDTDGEDALRVLVVIDENV